MAVEDWDQVGTGPFPVIGDPLSLGDTSDVFQVLTSTDVFLQYAPAGVTHTDENSGIILDAKRFASTSSAILQLALRAQDDTVAADRYVCQIILSNGTATASIVKYLGGLVDSTMLVATPISYPQGLSTEYQRYKFVCITNPVGGDAELKIDVFNFTTQLFEEIGRGTDAATPLGAGRIRAGTLSSNREIRMDRIIPLALS